MSRSIAILLTSNDTSDFARRFTHDGVRFTELLQPFRPDWRFETIPVKDDVFPADPSDYDGYVISGSPASVQGDDPWIAHLLDFIRQADRRRIPMFGACFGHQALALALGGEVRRSEKGWSLGTAPTHFQRFAPWMEPRQESVRLYSAHQEQVTRLPDGAELLGGDAFCPIGAFRIGNHVFTTEYHPEMTPAFIHGLVDSLDGKLDAATIARARKALEHPAEGRLFGQWIVNFLDQD
jgi:GMP synthase-like glutamine amidotransferase